MATIESTAPEYSQAQAASLPEYLKETARYILSVQTTDGAIPWFSGGKLDPWDHVESAMGLSTAGFYREAEHAYRWMQKQQNNDGSWDSHYFLEQDEFENVFQTHFIAYIATGVWHHFCVTQNQDFLVQMFPCVDKAIDCVLRHQHSQGEIAWAFDAKGIASDDALLTGCCSTARSLDCALRIAETLQQARPQWHSAALKLSLAITQKPGRFDRHWESKNRFAMDWYYPILAGVLSTEQAQYQIRQRWHEFIELPLGCRCVADEPWVTMAETSELIIALVASGQETLAEQLFLQIHQWRHDEDGGYWTGYVFRDNTIWPEEKTTWTAAAVLLAADALYGYTNGKDLFKQQQFVFCK